MIGVFAWLTTGRLAAAALQAVTFGALAVLVGPAELGVVGSAVAVLTVLQAVFDLGLSAYVVRTRAEAPDDGRVRAAVVLNRLTTAPLLVTALVAAWLVTAALGDGLGAAVLPLAVWAAAERNAETVAGVAIADGRASLATANLVVRRAVAAAGFAALCAAGTDPVLAYGVAMAAGSLLSVAWLNAANRTRLPEGGRAPLGHVLREARPFWVNTVAVQARTLDVPVVAATGGAVVGGLYSLASRATVPLRLVPTSLALALLPHATRAVGVAARRRVLTHLAWLVAGVAVAYLALAAWVPALVDAVPVLDEYRPAVVPVQILLLALPFGAVASVCTALLQGYGDAAFVSRAAVAMSAVCLVGAGVGAVLAGAEGAAVAFGGALVLQAALLATRLVRHHRAEDERPTRAGAPVREEVRP